MQLNGYLKQEWTDLTARFCNDAALTGRLYLEIERKYSSPKRHYHNLHHIQALLQLCNEYKDHIADAEVTAFAVFYHDFIYNVLRNDNEKRSARVAVKRLHELGVPHDKAEQVKLFIEATQHHQVTGEVTNRHDLQLFLDFDMSILGAPWDQYFDYMQKVRKEYGIFPDKLYIPGRMKFLQHCLKADFIFHTSVFRDQFEAAARENIGREFARLAEN